MLSSRRFWIILTFVFVNLIAVLAASWYLPPKFYPVWTMNHSPFLAQKTLVIKYYDWSRASDDRLVQKCMFGLPSPNVDVIKNITEEVDQNTLRDFRLYLYEQLPKSGGYELYRILSYIFLDQKKRGSIHYKAGREDSQLDGLRRLMESHPELALNLCVEASGKIPSSFYPMINKFAQTWAVAGYKDRQRLAKVVQIRETFVLDYFKDQQSDNHSWGNDVTLSSLAVLCYLGQGYEHKTSTDYQETIRTGLDYVMSINDHTVSRAERNYKALVTGEAYAMTMDIRLKEYCHQAANRVVADMKGSQQLKVQDLSELFAFKALQAAGCMEVPGKYLDIKKVDFAGVDQTDTLMFGIYNLADAWSRAGMAHVAALSKRFIEKELDFTKPQRTRDLKTLYILYLSSFMKAGPQYHSFRDPLLDEFTKLDHFEFDKQGCFTNLYKSSFIDRTNLLENMAYISLVMSIEGRYRRIGSFPPVKP